MTETTNRDQWWDDPRWPMPESEEPDNPYTELWGTLKAFRYHPRLAEAEWDWAIRILHAMGDLAMALDSDPLILALADAADRAREEVNGILEQVEALAEEEADTQGERARLFEQVCNHLDFFASLEEEKHPDSSVPQKIREVLIPLIEREGGIKSNAEQVAEHLARRRNNQ